MSFIELRPRARAIVKLASGKTDDNYTKEWLLRDEFGSWERNAIEFLQAPDLVAKVKEKNLSDEKVDDGIAAMLVLLALKAQLNVRTKKEAR